MTGKPRVNAREKATGNSRATRSTKEPTSAKLAHGGRRPGAGRPRARPGKRVPHVSRGVHPARLPVHVTLRSRLTRLRNELILKAFARAIAAANRRHGERFRIAHYSLQQNHVHLVVEAECAQALSRGMQGLAVRLAHRLNRALRRRGTFWADRFHSRRLSNAAEVRRVLVYVHANHRKHEPELGVGVDPYSSGIWFTGWEELRPLPLSIDISKRTLDLERAPVVRARTRLLRYGWRVHGRISIEEAPSRGTTESVTTGRR
jgi:REP element-mobilizing transposase RayT